MTASVSYSGQAIGILGLSYSGSTVLNYILDTHTHIYGGSELIRVISGKHNPYCAVCGASCPFWTSEKLKQTFQGGRSKLYANAASIFGKPIVCDSSKQINHFTRIIEDDHETTLHLIELCKHPIRHIASFVTNDLFKKLNIVTAEQIADYQSVHQKDIMRFATETAEHILAFYDRLDELKASTFRRCSIISLKYESLINDPADALTPMLARLGLSYESQMDDFSAAEHHPIGGNMGPHIQTAARHGVDITWGKVAEYRKHFYETSRKLKLDDKYQQTLSRDQVCDIEQLDSVHQLLCRLGYRPFSTLV